MWDIVVLYSKGAGGVGVGSVLCAADCVERWEVGKGGARKGVQRGFQGCYVEGDCACLAFSVDSSRA